MIRLSAHQAGFDETQDALDDYGFTFEEAASRQWRAAGSVHTAPGNPAIVVLENGESTLMLLSYEVELDELMRVADDVHGVDRSAWTAAGGVIQ